jgi:hypothetical protein
VRIDQARIAIRERSWLDNLDLALHVIRTRAGGVLVAGTLGALPMIAVNYAIIHYALGDQLSEGAGFDAMLLAMFLVMIEAPLGTAPLTLYLGQALFVEKPEPRRIARDLAGCLPQLILYQLILRIVLIVPVLTWIIPYALWPYLNEVILLERNPLVSGRGQISTMKRNALLHRGNSGDYMVRGLCGGLLAAGLVLALVTTKNVILEVLLGFQEGWTSQVISFQCVLWVVAGYFTVARFLSYLDQRIRGEGWEVELTLRVQRERLMRHAA